LQKGNQVEPNRDFQDGEFFFLSHRQLSQLHPFFFSFLSQLDHYHAYSFSSSLQVLERLVPISLSNPNPNSNRPENWPMPCFVTWPVDKDDEDALLLAGGKNPVMVEVEAGCGLSAVFLTFFSSSSSSSSAGSSSNLLPEG
jgi:hypothetical protein